MSFDLENLPFRGGGLWKFNNSLLDDQKFCIEMLALIELLLVVRHLFFSYPEFWEILKNMKSLAISYSNCKRRAASHRKVFLTNHLIYLKGLLAGGDLSVKSHILEAEAALQSLFDSELEGHKIGSRVKWLEEGEATSAFVSKLENQKHRKFFISSVWKLEGREFFLSRILCLLMKNLILHFLRRNQSKLKHKIHFCPMCLGLFLKMIG